MKDLKKLRKKISEGKELNRKELASKLQLNSVRYLWSGMKKMTGFKVKGDRTNKSHFY